MNTKQCNKCNQTKPTTEFYAHKHTKDGLYGSCKKCHNKRSTKAEPVAAQQAAPVFYAPSEQGMFNQVAALKSAAAILETVIIPRMPDREVQDILMDVVGTLYRMADEELAAKSKFERESAAHEEEWRRKSAERKAAFAAMKFKTDPPTN